MLSPNLDYASVVEGPQILNYYLIDKIQNPRIENLRTRERDFIANKSEKLIRLSKE